MSRSHHSGARPPRVLIISFSDLERDPRVNRQIHFVRDGYEVIAAGLADPKIDGVQYISLVPDPPPAPAPASPAEGAIAPPPTPPEPQVPRTRLQALVFHALRVRNIPRRLRRVARQRLEYWKHLRHQREKRVRFEARYWSADVIQAARKRLGDLRADVIIANDPSAWPLAVEIADGARLIFDAHEYSPREYDNSWRFRWYDQAYKTYLCKEYIPRCDQLLTVAEDIADYYQKDTGKRATVITNAPAFHAELAPRLYAGDTTRPIRLVHHGLAAPVRRLEHYLDMMALLDDHFELHFMLLPSDPAYYAKLQRRAQADRRIHFDTPVPMRDLPRHLNEHFDVGAFLIEPENFNHLHSLPNKFFEWVQGRLALAVGPSRELGDIVRKLEIGVIADDFSHRSLARRLNRTSRDEIDEYKRRSHAVARTLSADTNREILRGVVAKVLEGAPTAPRVATSEALIAT